MWRSSAELHCKQFEYIAGHSLHSKLFDRMVGYAGKSHLFLHVPSSVVAGMHEVLILYKASGAWHDISSLLTISMAAQATTHTPFLEYPVLHVTQFKFTMAPVISLFFGMLIHEIVSLYL